MADAGVGAARARVFKVLVLNQVSPNGLKRLPVETYATGKDVADPDAVLVRSADMHGMEIPASVKAIARAGAGTNNIPVKAMSARGVPVFNAPGANANAVKELVLAGMLMAARNLAPAQRFVEQLDPASADLDKTVEDGKKSFAGYELAGQTLGIIGLGKIGCLVADAAIKLGMNVLGYDPEITVDAAWSLPAQVKKAASVTDVLKNANFISLHVPLVEATRHLVNEKNVALAKPGAVLLNFSREGVVSDSAVLAALGNGQLGWYVCDFPSGHILKHPQGRRAAAPGRIDPRGRGELRHHGRRPAARLLGERQHRQRGELPQRQHGTGSRAIAWPSPMPTCPTMLGQISPPWLRRA
jgi:D-3-phosphoglycerate dehydrogenase